MDDYLKLEQELQQLYAEYVQKFRNLTFMEQVQREYDRAEQERTLVKLIFHLTQGLISVVF